MAAPPAGGQGLRPVHHVNWQAPLPLQPVFTLPSAARSHPTLSSCDRLHPRKQGVRWGSSSHSLGFFTCRRDHLSWTLGLQCETLAWPSLSAPKTGPVCSRQPERCPPPTVDLSPNLSTAPPLKRKHCRSIREGTAGQLTRECGSHSSSAMPRMTLTRSLDPSKPQSAPPRRLCHIVCNQIGVKWNCPQPHGQSCSCPSSPDPCPSP